MSTAIVVNAPPAYADADPVEIVDTAQGGESAALPVLAPEAPGRAATAAGDRRLGVHWEPPPLGSGPVETYEVVVRRQASAAPEPIVVDGTQTEVAVPGLVNGVRYDVAVTASNSLGSSEPATAVGTPRTVPGAPAVTSVSASDGAGRVHWKAPSTGGAPIRGYVVRAQPSGTTVRVGAAASSARITGLRNGTPTTFTVAARNVAGTGSNSSPSARVVPRKIAKLIVRRQPDNDIAYGTRSVMRASVVNLAGTGLAGQRVVLLAKRPSATSWHRVDAGSTGSEGNVTLRARLAATSRLKLHHPAGAVAARDTDVRGVTVAKRVTRTISRTRVRQGMAVVVWGTVAPDQHVGGPVYLQRRVSGSWRRVAAGKMTAPGRYRLEWSPAQAGTYVLRVRRDGDDARAAGSSRRWRQLVLPETAADVAADILSNRRITLAEVHLSAGRDGATARDNLLDLAAGRRAQTSCFSSAPCSAATVDLRLLQAVRAMGERTAITVSEVAGGAHAGRSDHYRGSAVDITWVNGRHVAPGSSYGIAVDRCRAFGATEVFTPSSDPWGGHSRHIHCAWS